MISSGKVIGRGHFVTGLLGIAFSPNIAVGKTSSSLLTHRPSLQVAEIASLMRRVGYTSIIDRPNPRGQRVMYRIDGTWSILAPNMICTEPDGTTCPGNQGDYTDSQVIDWTYSKATTYQTYINYQLYTQYSGTAVTSPLGGFPIEIGPLYSIGKATVQCPGPAAAIYAAAVAVGKYLATSEKFGSIAAQAAENFMAKWGSTGIGPVAASIFAAGEFLSSLVALLTVGEWLAIIAALGITGLEVYDWWRCANGA